MVDRLPRGATLWEAAHQHPLRDPKDSWRAVYELQHGCAHARAELPTVYRGKDGTVGKTPQQNADILGEHFRELFNRPTSFDPTVLDEVRQRDTYMELDDEPSVEEVTLAVKFSCVQARRPASRASSPIA